MNLETGHPICSLCRRELSDLSFEREPETKLCDVCRGLIQTALRGTQAQAAAASAGAQQSAVVAYAESGASPVAGPLGSVEAESPAYFDGLPNLAGTSEQAHPAEFFNIDDGSFEMNIADEPAENVEADASSFDAIAAEPAEYSDQPAIEPLPSTESLSFEQSEPRSEPREELKFDLGFDSSVALSAESRDLNTDLSGLHQSLLEDSNGSAQHSVVSAPALDEQIDQDSNEHEDAQSNAPAATIDPWEDPLPAWDYSKNEWPVLMGPPRESSFAKYKAPFAVIMILVFGAGFYYFVYPQISRDQPPPESSIQLSRASETPASTNAPADSAAQSPAQSAPSDAPVSAEAKPTQQASVEAVVANETSNAQGHFALQAAAFPTQAGADEFAEKLKSAGVPTHVVSADLARRGRWFRVRVGRFNTAEDAQRFAAEAQRRAKAAGMSLQLMVSQYEQP